METIGGGKKKKDSKIYMADTLMVFRHTSLFEMDKLEHIYVYEPVTGGCEAMRTNAMQMPFILCAAGPPPTLRI